ncbi:MAG: hypothetical protein KJ749_02705 [Planctomycetes bacterium]|nr:hypothetical protein [Planctomycetota bacterium]
MAFAISAWSIPCWAVTGESEPAESESAAPLTSVQPALPEQEIKPRFELRIPDVRKALAELDRSHAGVFAAHLRQMTAEMASASAEGIDANEAGALLEQIGHWPDTSIDAVMFAPDTEGQARWAVRVDWPVADLHQRVKGLLESGAASELLEGVTLSPDGDGAYNISLAGAPLGYLLSAGESRAFLASHKDLPLPDESFSGTPETEGDGASVVTCRLNLTGTEKDSGATFFSSFSMLTDIVYGGRVDDDGDWIETFYIHWPPISGVGVKTFLGKIKQTFFVPDEAFGAASLKALMLPGMLEGMAGFGPQVVMDSPGELAIVGEATVGPVASSVGSQACITVLPGTGFLPAPDIVIQMKANKDPEKLMKELAEAAQRVNELHRERERPEPWHQAEVRERTVIWSDGTNNYPGMLAPFSMRPVLFTTKEADPRDRETDYLVLAWTSTSPQKLVRRWLDLPRGVERRFLPTTRKSHGQLWVNWKQVYRWLSPYANLTLGVVVPDAILPRAEDIEGDLTDALLAAEPGYAGLRVTHQGPIPLGAFVVPTLVSASTVMDESGDSDLARERLASRQLKVLHHHAKLFQKDVGRWPAEVAELDGYVDFAGHPELLELKLSSRKEWSQWFEGVFDFDEEETKDEDEEEIGAGIDDDLYVIEWGRDSWSLGLAPDTLEHLEKLFIDQNGKLHRVEKIAKSPTEPAAEDTKPESGESVSGPEGTEIRERVAVNSSSQSLPSRQESEKE